MREGKILPRDVHMERRHEYLHRGFKLQLLFCAGPPCIDPQFAAVGGPTYPGSNWSASSSFTNSALAWVATFNIPGGVAQSSKTLGTQRNRAVRAGSCSS